MTDTDRDPMLDRAIDELRTLPPVDHAAVSRIVAAAATARLNAADDDDVLVLARPRRAMRWGWTIGIAAAAGVAGFVARGAWISSHDLAAPAAASSAPHPNAQVRAAADVDSDARPVPRPFVLDKPNARRVALVGDFNNWNPTATPLTRDPVSGLWTVVVPIAPGRHLYAFMIDSVLSLDPRAPKTKDPALGVEGSVIIVGKP